MYLGIGVAFEVWMRGNSMLYVESKEKNNHFPLH